MTVTVVKIWTIEADQLPVHYPTSTSKYKNTDAPGSVLKHLKYLNTVCKQADLNTDEWQVLEAVFKYFKYFEAVFSV